MNDSTRDPDVLIIGAGASGAVAAKRLGEAGFRVVVLEQGGWPDYSRARAAHPDFEITAGREWNWNPNARRAPADYPVEESQSDITALMYNGVGGGTVIYAAHWQRNMPSDFRVRTMDGIADDWPLTYEELQPFYDRVEQDVGVSGLAGDTAFPPGSFGALPPMPLGAMGRRVAKAHNRLGWHWWPGPNAIATRPYRHLRACVQRATCLWGCVDQAKGTFDITHWPYALAAGVELVLGARVRRLLTADDGRVTGAEWVDREGEEHVQRAAVTILCANGIGTPRLLLLSAGPGHPDGLANSSGLVGRRLMMHPFGTVVGLFDDDLGSWQGPWGQHIHSLQFYESDASRGFVRGAKWGLQPTGGPLSTTRSYPWGANNAIWGDGFHEGVRTRLGRSAMWGIIAEDLPEASNRVVLDERLADSDGIPAPRIQYRLSENSRRMLDFHQQRARESLEAAGAYQTLVAPLIRETGWHLLGTAVMGDDPTRSVVDRWGRAHDVPNLYVFDGSVWPTSAGMNPTATIAALALRSTDHLIEERRNQVTGRRIGSTHAMPGAWPVPVDGVVPPRPTAATEHASDPAREAASHKAPGLVDAAARARLASLADVLIPAGDGMPAASETEVAGRWLDEVLRARPDITDDLLRVLAEAADGSPVDAVRRLREERTDDFAVLATVVPGAYFMDPGIQARLGYRGQAAVPIPPETPDEEERALIASVAERGAIYRPTPA